MAKTREVTHRHDALEPGFYWYFGNGTDDQGVVVQVEREPGTSPPSLYVYWPGDERDRPVGWCLGRFVGPLIAPLSEGS